MKHLYDEEPVFVPYSNSDKIIIYKAALKEILKDIKKDETYGLCFYMARGCRRLKAMESVDIVRKGFWSEESIDETPFPELMKYKPEIKVNSFGFPGGIFWFALDTAGMQRRVEIITEILINLVPES